MPSRSSASRTRGSQRISTSCGALAVVEEPLSLAQAGMAASSVTPARQPVDDVDQRRTRDRAGDRRAVGGLPVEVAAIGDAVGVVAQRHAQLARQVAKDATTGSQLCTCWWESRWVGSRPVRRRKALDLLPATSSTTASGSSSGTTS